MQVAKVGISIKDGSRAKSTNQCKCTTSPLQNMTGQRKLWIEWQRWLVLSETRYEHIILNESQVPIISGTNLKVVELVLDHLAYGWSPEELHFQHPTLSMGQIHSALAYYWDHKAEIDQDIERRLQLVDHFQQTTPESPLANQLKARKQM
jgi:uncharacterized protein (DUF433 family)